MLDIDGSILFLFIENALSSGRHVGVGVEVDEVGVT